MATRRDPGLARLTREITRLDAAAIDALYGLEPVFEPGAAPAPLPAGGHALTEFTQVQCPYCWEFFETVVDVSGGSCTYVEDCQVCCQPIEFDVVVTASGALAAVRPGRMD